MRRVCVEVQVGGLEEVLGGTWVSPLQAWEGTQNHLWNKVLSLQAGKWFPVAEV